MGNPIKIIDDLVSPSYCDYLQNLIEDSKLPLFFNANTLRGYKTQDEKILLGKNEKDSCQFTHVFFDNKVPQSAFWNEIQPVVLSFCSLVQAVQNKTLIRCKLNLNCKDESYLPNEHYPVHIDLGPAQLFTDKEKYVGVTAIYYLNDSDGDTLFFDDDKNVTFTCSPKKGRIVYFDNKILHAGCPPKVNEYRALINFNWIEESTCYQTAN